MKHVLILGSGRSSFHLIEYLIQQADTESWKITIADRFFAPVWDVFKNHPRTSWIELDLNSSAEWDRLFNGIYFVISLLPPSWHVKVAQKALENNIHMATASYLSPEVLKLQSEIEQKQLFFLNECGLDPGLDHASAMDMIARLKAQNATIEAFYSYCGGLPSPKTSTDRWGYKFSWNPRNVILAGQSHARFKENGTETLIPYVQLFKRAETVCINSIPYDAYANRDSLTYLKTYGLPEIPSFKRGTLRRSGFCIAWNVWVALGLTDDTLLINIETPIAFSDFVNRFLPSGSGCVESRMLKAAGYPEDSDVINHLLDLKMSEFTVTAQQCTPAQILQSLLENRWQLNDLDTDLVLMYHEIYYTNSQQKRFKKTSTFELEGVNNLDTAMSKSVGLPLALSVAAFLKGQIRLSGLIIPTHPVLYTYLLKELAAVGLVFKETEEELV